MTYPSSANPNESSAPDDARLRTLLDNLNNLRNKLRNFTVIDELGQPIGEIRDLILDNGHQLNLVISKLNGQKTKPSVLLNGRRIKKVSVQTQSVFVDITKLDTQFLPEYSLSEDSTIGESEESRLFVAPPPVPEQSADLGAEEPLSTPSNAVSSVRSASSANNEIDLELPEPSDNLDIPVADYLAADELAVSDLLTPDRSSQSVPELAASVGNLPLEEEFALPNSSVDDLNEDLVDWGQESDDSFSDFDLFRDESSLAESLDAPLEPFNQAFSSEPPARPSNLDTPSATESRLAEELSELDLDVGSTTASTDFNLEAVESPLNLDFSLDTAFPNEEPVGGGITSTGGLEDDLDSLSILDLGGESSIDNRADLDLEAADSPSDLDLLLSSDFLSEESNLSPEVLVDEPVAGTSDLDFALEDSLTKDLPSLDLSLDEFATSLSDHSSGAIDDIPLEPSTVNEEAAPSGIPVESTESRTESTSDTIASLTDLGLFLEESSSLQGTGLPDEVVEAPQPANLDISGFSGAVGSDVLIDDGGDRGTPDDAPDVSSSLVTSGQSSELARRDSAPLDTVDEIVPLLEERLQVEYQRRKVGEVIVRKKIETRMVQVPVRYEKLVIEQISPERKSLAEVDLSQGELTGVEMPGISGSPMVSGTFKSPKKASYVLDAIAKTLRHRCKSVRIEIELEDGKLQDAYQEWIDQCSRL